MELPHIGDQCSEASCRQLDFLPVKCDGCKKHFCGQHWTYQGHNCASPRLKDVQVPVCPMCDKPVPSKPGAVPDEAVSRHLDRDCQADVKKNPRCSKAKCKVRELIKVDCNQCGLNFCLKHRFPTDHDCTGTRSSKNVSDAGKAAMARQQQEQSRGPAQGIAKYFQRQAPATAAANGVRSRANASHLQGNLSEDEALARALQASLADNQPNSALSQEEMDRMLALSLAQGEQHPQTSSSARTSTNNDKSCQIS